MAAKRKISVRRILQAAVTVIVTIGSMVLFIGASRQQQRQTITGIDLHINNANKYRFLDKQTMLRQLIQSRGIEINKTRVNKLDIKGIEHDARYIPWVGRAEAYLDNRYCLHVQLTQRVPAARIFCNDGTTYYVDTACNLLPTADGFSYYTTIVTNVPRFSNDSMNRALRSNIIRLVRFIERDTFWNAQIDQVIVREDLTFELVPVLGTHTIYLGDLSGLHEKFNSLLAFYKQVLNPIGWNAYTRIDLSVKDQLIASPSFKNNQAPGTAISGLSWAKNTINKAQQDSTGKKDISPQPNADHPH